jgi:predicted AAA+ superfamily ATPase
MIPRKAFHAVLQGLDQFPAVALLGPRQVGKTTLALEVARTFNPNHLYLDLESELDQAKLANARLFLGQQKDRLVVIDEVHRKPALFSELRGLIDEAKRQGSKAGQYLLLGSASLDLLKQAGETLAGRILYTELYPLQ